MENSLKHVSTSSQEDLSIFKKMISSYNNKVIDLRSSYVKSKIKECAHKPKKFFKVVHQITTNTRINPLPPVLMQWIMTYTLES